MTMAELHDLSPVQGSRKNRKRIGRGPGSGTGKTSGKGHKGHKARTGGPTHRHFEGGQMPLHRRLPKRGFHNPFRTEYQVVNVGQLAEAGLQGEVTPAALRAGGLIGSLRLPVKILGNGELSAALTVHAHAFSASARQKIEQAGGAAHVVEVQG
jgi:large subunit ribosomal protein L15